MSAEIVDLNARRFRRLPTPHSARWQISRQRCRPGPRMSIGCGRTGS
jgi:hypothetical protein